MTQSWTIRPVCFGEIPSYEKSWLTYMQNPGDKIRVPLMGWLLESGAEIIMVDTGPSPPQVANQWHTYLEQTAEQSPKVALENAGVDVTLVKLVILTHLHWDHCHNLDLFPRAQFVVQRRELRTAIDPISTQRVPYEAGVPGLCPAWLSVFDRMEPIDGDAEIASGLRLIVLPGHTPGLQGVLVDTTQGRHLIASDAIPLYENLGTDETGPIPPGFHTDVAACLRSLARARDIADVILPGHDLAVLRHGVYPISQ